MIRRLFLLLSLPLVVAAAPSFEKELRPVLEKTCFKCHGTEKQKGGVELASFTDEGAVLRKFKVWRNAVAQLEMREMPPDEDALSDADRARLTAGLKEVLARLDDEALRDPGPALIRRLSRAEYNNAIRDVLGFEADVARLAGMPEDSTGTSYENIAQALQVSPALIEKYFAAADEVLATMFPEPDAIVSEEWEVKDRAQRARKAGTALLKDVPTDRAGAQKVLAQIARRAWRRPVEEGETERMLKLFDAATARGEAFPLAMRRALKPVLVSPKFLFRSEEDRGAGATKIGDVELASRLSFFLWSSIPDEPLLALAEKGELSQPETLAAQVQRMLADAKAKAFTENFLTRWLQLDKLATARPSTEFFPTFNDAMKREMRTEVVTFCDKLREEDRSVLDLLNCDYTYANDELAKHYGLAGVSGKDFQRVALQPADHRGGVLGMGAVLALSSHTSRTSPTLRGKYVLDVLFGTPPLPPPANAGQIDEKKKTPDGHDPKNFREKLALHATDAVCAGCHKKLDPLGFGLDNYDAIGAWRPSGGDLDTSAELPGGVKFNGVGELRQILWERRVAFERNLIAQTLQYALGRELEFFDEGAITRIQTALGNDGHKFSALILGVVNSYPFQNRRNAEPAPDVTAARTGMP